MQQAITSSKNGKWFILRPYLFDYTANTINHQTTICMYCKIVYYPIYVTGLRGWLFAILLFFLLYVKCYPVWPIRKQLCIPRRFAYFSFIIAIRFTLYFVLFCVIRFTSYDYELDKFLLSKFTKKAKPIRLKEFSFLFLFAVINCSWRSLSRSVRASFRRAARIA